jgi:hypothetical protein
MKGYSTKINFRCTVPFKKEVIKIADSEYLTTAAYIKGLIVKDMKQREIIIEKKEKV